MIALATTRAGYALLALIFFGAGCENLTAVKQSLRGEDAASLRLEIQPHEGLTVRIDGVEVGVRSPLELLLVPGAHMLEIRAAGHHNFSLPLTLKGGARVSLPIALRPTKIERPKARAASPTTLSAFALPRGVLPIDVRYTVIPARTLYLDNVVTSGPKLTLARLRGTIVAGELRLDYQRRGAEEVRIIVPNEQALWQCNDEVVLSGGSFLLRQGESRISRVGKDGFMQTLVLVR